MTTTVGILHPGAMGSELAACCNAEHRLWVVAGRSAATVQRADEAGLEAVRTVDEICGRADLVVSICPPAAAAAVAREVAEAGFDGIYLDANAISPDHSRSIGRLFERFVDGSVVGPPPTVPGAARLYVSGPSELTELIERLWAGSNLEVRSVGPQLGAASALKMAYAGWTKGSSALLLAVAALAEVEGVTEALRAEWDLSQPELAARLDAGATRGAPKAWRFGAEMEEIASTLADAGLPAGFHVAAAEVYNRLASFKDREPTAAEVLDQLSGQAMDW
ncbi:MAG: DUF1932 domain-containing protein [Acidimicrobiales bacterium]